jgi:hypothetical protein
MKDEGGRMNDEPETLASPGSSFILPPSSFRCSLHSGPSA